MAATIIIFVFIGKFADQYFGNEKPVLIAVFSVLGVFLSLYNLIKEVKINDN
jgi:F0F1-type ATP synthase assembly protein I